MIGDGLLLMVLGMGVVLVFLCLLYGLTTLMGRLVPAGPAPAAPKRPVSAPSGASDDATLVAVISAALAAHRSRG